ncbi:hypothetical protein F4680DRAFT_434821 [Xylaria scruposa]|nr:hypothetical protein F4680DRAFT_434821 [Xylaria scruposa]
MFSSKFLAVVLLTVTPILAGTPQGYGYGDMTDTYFGASTDSPAYTDTLYSVVPLTTITNSVTLTKPVTVTVTHTVSPECSSEMITTISGTTSTTLTTKITVFVPGGSSPGTPTTQPTVAPGFSGADISTVTIGTPIVSTTGFAVSDTTTSCVSITSKLLPSILLRYYKGILTRAPIASAEVDGVTESSSGTSTGASTVSISPNTETSSVRSGASNGSTGIVATRTSSSTVPLPTIVMSTGAQWMVDARLLTGAAILPFWVLVLAI